MGHTGRMQVKIYLEARSLIDSNWHQDSTSQQNPRLLLIDNERWRLSPIPLHVVSHLHHNWEYFYSVEVGRAGRVPSPLATVDNKWRHSTQESLVDVRAGAFHNAIAETDQTIMRISIFELELERDRERERQRFPFSLSRAGGYCTLLSGRKKWQWYRLIIFWCIYCWQTFLFFLPSHPGKITPDIRCKWPNRQTYSYSLLRC